MSHTDQPTSILVVEDVPLLRRMTALALTSAGHQVIEAGTGEEALHLAAEHHPDLILLDIGLPDMDGLEVCRRIKADPATADILVAFLSSTHTDLDTQIGGLETGADAFISRPLSNRELQARVDALLRLKRAENGLRQANARLQAELAARAEAEARLRIIAENTYAWEFWIGPNEELLYCSSACERITGYAAAEFMGRPGLIREIIYPADRPIWDEHERKVAATGRPDETQFRIIHRDGAMRWVAHACSPVYAADGAPWGRRGSSWDITAQRRIQEDQARVARALRESEAQFRALTETAASAIFIYQDDIFRYVNKMTEQITGYPAHELIGMHFWEVVHPDDREMVRQRGMARQRGEPMPPRYTFRIVTRTGETRWVDFTGGLIQYRGRPAGLGTAFDITDLVLAQQAEQEQRRLAEALRDTAAALASPLSFDAMLDRILEVVGRVMQHDAANILLIEEGVARVGAHRGYEGRMDEALIRDIRLPIATTANLRRMIETGRPYAIPDTRTDPAWVDAPGTRWVRSHAAAPIRVKGSVIGFLSLDSATPGFFTQEKADRVQGFADQAGMALENAQLLDDLRRRGEEFAAVYNIAVRLAGESDLSALLDAIAEQTQRLLRSATAWIYLYDPDRGDLEMTATSGRTRGRGTRLALGEGLAGLVAAERRAHQVDDYSSWDNRSPQFDEMQVAATVAVPLIYAGELVGALGASEYHPSTRRFGDDDIRLLDLIAGYAAAAIRNAQLRRNLERELAERRRVEEMLRTVLDTIPHGVFWKDRNSIYAGCNKTYAREAGLAGPEELIGKSDDDLPWRASAELFRAEDRRILATGAPMIGVEQLVERNDGRRVWERVNKVPLYDADGSIRGILGTFEDITSQKQAEEKLKQTLAELERSNADLEQFAYMASHDLQEPLRMVSSFLGLLAERYEGRLDADADQFIQFAVDGARRMQNLINALLEYSRVTTRGRPPQPTDANVALQDALWNLQVAIEEAGATVTHDPLPTVLADPTQLMQLFQNLIGNAIKFRRDEPPTVHISARPAADAGPAGKMWEFSVADNGIGIDPKFHERIFGVFQRLHTQRQYPGTGIGLAICKKIVERHGGRIWVESEPGKGSTFYFTLPAAP